MIATTTATVKSIAGGFTTSCTSNHDAQHNQHKWLIKAQEDSYIHIKTI